MRSGAGGANLYRRGRIWWARVQVNGRDFRRSLRTSSKLEAGKRLKPMLEGAQHARFFGEARYRWQDAVTAWVAQAPKTLRPATVKRYLVSLRRVRGILDGLYIDEIELKTIARIARRAGVSNATRRRDLTAVSMVLRWSVAQGWRADNPARVWDRGVVPERREPVALPEPYDIDCAVAAAPGNFARLIRFAQFTGMREEEAASLEWREIDRGRAAAQLSRTKTRRPRSVPLDERALGTLAGTAPRLGCPFVFWHEVRFPAAIGAAAAAEDGPDASRYLNVASRFAAITKRSRALAKAEDRALPRRFRFHDLRHWFAVDYLRRGGSIYRLKQILGHSSIRTTELYLDFLTPDEQEQAKTAPAQSPVQK